MKKGIRRSRGCMPLVPAGCLAEDLLGNSVQKLGFLPEAQNDMIFSIICEELGLIGASLVIGLFLILIWRFFVIATSAKDLTGALIATGAMAHMMIQVILSIAVVTNSIPNTGITCPVLYVTEIRCVFTAGNGACIECVESGRIELRRRRRMDAAKEKENPDGSADHSVISSDLVFSGFLLFQTKKIEVTGNQYCQEKELVEWIQKDKYAFNSLYIWWKYNQEVTNRKQ